jgi:hypothetical protein
MMEGFEMPTQDTKSRKIRALSTGLAVLITMGSLAACDSGPPPTTTTTRQVTTDTVAPAPVPAQQTTTVQRTTTTNP